MVKKQLKSLTALDRAIDNAHDIAVAKHVLWSLYLHIKGEKVFIREDPFIDKELNEDLYFLYDLLVEKYGK